MTVSTHASLAIGYPFTPEALKKFERKGGRYQLGRKTYDSETEFMEALCETLVCTFDERGLKGHATYVLQPLVERDGTPDADYGTLTVGPGLKFETAAALGPVLGRLADRMRAFGIEPGEAQVLVAVVLS